MEDTRKLETLGLFVVEELQRNMLPGHAGIVHVVGFDEGFACPPDGRLVVDCVDPRDGRRVLCEGLGVWKRLGRSGEGEVPPIAIAPAACLVGRKLVVVVGGQRRRTSKNKGACD
jgi:hypothetical protein